MHAPTSTATPRIVIGLLLGLQFVSMGAMEMSGPFWPLYLKPLSSSEWVFSLAGIGVYVCPMIGIMATSAFWGRIGDRYGNKLMMIRALLGLCITQLLIAFATDVWMILALRFLQGACAGYVAPAQAYGVQIETPARRAQLFAHLQIATNVGSFAGAVFGGLILDRAPFALINVTAGILCALCAAVAWLVLPGITPAPPASAAKDGPSSRSGPQGQSPTLPIAGLIILLCLLLASRMITQTPFSLYVQSVFGASNGLTGLCYGLLAFGFIVSASRWARVFSGRSPAEMLRGLMAVAAACAVLTLIAGSTRTIAVFIALYFVWGVLLGATTPVLTAAISAATELQHQGRILGIAQSAQQFASIVGIALGVWFSATIGLESIYFFVALAYSLALGATIALWYGYARRRS